MTKLSELEKLIKELQRKCCCKETLFVTELPVSGKEGILYINTETGEILIWDGSTFVSVGFSGEWGDITGDIEDQTDLINYIADNSVELIEDITYAQLVTKIGGSTLNVGQQYNITDFATVHYFNSGTSQLADVNTATTEPLIVTAISANTISSLAQSVLYPQDTIHYDWNPANWLNDRSFSDATGSATLSGTTIISGFKGVIYYRHDRSNNNLLGYDFRGVKFRRWKGVFTAWTDTNFNKGSIVDYGGSAFIAVRDITMGSAAPNFSSTLWTNILSDTSKYLFLDSNLPTGVTLGTEYDDFFTFAYVAIRPYSKYVRNNIFNTNAFKRDNNSGNTQLKTILTNNVFQNQTTTNGGVFGNTFQSNTYNNTFIADTSNNSCKNSFINNIFIAFNENEVDFFCQKNIFVTLFNNKIGTDFLRNMGEFTSYCHFGIATQDNVLGYNFTRNKLIDTVTGNYIDINCLDNEFFVMTSCIIAENFKRNSVRYMTSKNLLTATLVYNTYDKSIFLNSASVQSLSYIDASNVLQIALPTA